MKKFVPRVRKHRVQARLKRGGVGEVGDGGKEVIGKKRKRLEKYLENKLRKDKAMKYLRKLEVAHQEFASIREREREGIKEQERTNGNHEKAKDWGEWSESESELENISNVKRDDDEKEYLKTINDEANREFKTGGFGCGLKVKREESNEGNEENGIDEANDRGRAFMEWAIERQNENAELGVHERKEKMEWIEKESARLLNDGEVKLRDAREDEDDVEGLVGGFSTEEGLSRTVHPVKVDREDIIEEERIKLPVVREEQRIMEAVHNNGMVVICGETGSGKTTQIPQFLYEAGYGDENGPRKGMIGITQTRRVAAVSMSKRVKIEMGEFHGKRVGYQIRFEGKVNEGTAIKFMTDGVLLREMMRDEALLRYSVIIIDEVHERRVNTDILIGLLGRIMCERERKSQEGIEGWYPLKVIIMSATLRMGDVEIDGGMLMDKPRNEASKLKSLGWYNSKGEFKRAIVVSVEGRQFPVVEHFSRRTKADYVDEAFRKIKKGHEKLAAGGMLVFLTSKEEIWRLGKRIQQELPCFDVMGDKTRDIENCDDFQGEQSCNGEGRNYDGGMKYMNNWDISDEDMKEKGCEYIEDFDDDESSESEMEDKNLDQSKGEENGWGQEKGKVLREEFIQLVYLHSQLPMQDQMRVFQAAHENCRMVILSTNIAETSLTIPGIRYVIDSGRAKRRKYDQLTGVEKFEIGWISKNSAVQRCGRAGRIESGHCYRLYSSSIYENDFPEFDDAEIQSVCLENIVLQMMQLGVSVIRTFPFLTRPDDAVLNKSLDLLVNLGFIRKTSQSNIPEALCTNDDEIDDGMDSIHEGEEEAKYSLTSLASATINYPLSPRLSKILFVGLSNKLTRPFTLDLVSALSVPEIFISQNQIYQYFHEGSQWQEAYKKFHESLTTWDNTSDAIKVLCLLRRLESLGKEVLRYTYVKSLKEMVAVRHQLAGIREMNSEILDDQKVPDEREILAIKQLIASGFIDQLAIRADLLSNVPGDIMKLCAKAKRVSQVPYLCLFPPVNVNRGTREGNSSESGFVYVHSSSILAHKMAKSAPKYVVYSRLQSTQNSRDGECEQSRLGKTLMYPLTSISAGEIFALTFNTPLIQYSPKPTGKIIPLSPHQMIFKGKGNGSCMVQRRLCWLIPNLRGRYTGFEAWPLPPVQVVQARHPTKGWILEKICSMIQPEK